MKKDAIYQVGTDTAIDTTVDADRNTWKPITADFDLNFIGKLFRKTIFKLQNFLKEYLRLWVGITVFRFANFRD